MPETEPRRRAILLWGATFVAVCLSATFTWHARDRILNDDFIPLYSGPHLIDSGDLYDNAQLLERERRVTGMYSETHGYIRPPFVAVLMWPVSRLPYWTAWRVWQATSLAALAAFVLLWQPEDRALTALAVAASLPALLVWLKGQDVFFLLLAVAVTVRLHLQGKAFAAGAVFALCAAKPHLFLLTPVLILAQCGWGFLKGLLSGGGVLFLVSTLAAGWRWPLEMLRETQNPAFSPNVEAMPNLHGAVSLLPSAWMWELALSVAVAWAVWRIARHSSFATAIAASLLGGILLARHSYLLDLALVVPAVLQLHLSVRSVALRLAAFATLTPPIALLAMGGQPYSAALTLTLWAVLMGWAFETYHATQMEMDGTPA